MNLTRFDNTKKAVANLLSEYEDDLLQELVEGYEQNNNDLVLFIPCVGKDTILDVTWESKKDLDLLLQNLIDVSQERKKIPLMFYFPDKDQSIYPYFVEYMNEPIIEKPKIEKRKLKKKEQDLENELYFWMLANGINCHKQVKTSNKISRFDIWIEGKAILELKAKNVTANDICQIIKYYEQTEKTIILVANHCSLTLLQTIDSFNSILGKEHIKFVAWDFIKMFIKQSFMK